MFLSCGVFFFPYLGEDPRLFLVRLSGVTYLVLFFLSRVWGFGVSLWGLPGRIKLVLQGARSFLMQDCHYITRILVYDVIPRLPYVAREGGCTAI
jgi:hypothetical protein